VQVMATQLRDGLAAKTPEVILNGEVELDFVKNCPLSMPKASSSKVLRDRPVSVSA